jgi:hypothetical protein
VTLQPEDLYDERKYRHLITIRYGDIISFVLDQLRRKTGVILFFWSFCLITLGLAVVIRINISGYFELRKIFLHTLLGMIVLPVLIIPLHELLHIIPYILSGAKRIRVGMDLKQYIFYVTAHRHVASSGLFRIVAVFPFIVVTAASLFLIWWLPGLWKYSVAVFLFIHSTMCAGDFAMISFCNIYRKHKVYTWDDAELKEAYFYEELEGDVRGER